MNAMPKLTLVVERKPVQVYDLKHPVIRIGRVDGMEIMIDNISVSRRQAEIRQEADGSWTVRDLGSANGTFLNGRRLTAAQPVTSGDEISFGKFALFFDRVLSEPLVQTDVAPRQGFDQAAGTFRLRTEDVDELQRAAGLKRRAQLQWEVGRIRDTHYLERGPRAAVLIGRSTLCDLQVPAGPKHHLLVIRNAEAFEARNLSGWHRMRVNGQVTRKAVLRSGDVIDIAGLRVTFLDEVR